MTINFTEITQKMLIKNWRLDKYVYLMNQINEYKQKAKNGEDFAISTTFQNTYILFYDMQKDCFTKKDPNVKNAQTLWGKNFFKYLKRLIIEQGDNEYLQFDEQAKQKLEEIIYVLSSLEEIPAGDFQNFQINFQELAKKSTPHKVKLYKSFATKLFATLNPNMTILDQNVIQNLKNTLSEEFTNQLKISENSKKELKDRVISTLAVYKEIYLKEQEMLNDKKVLKEINDFQKFYNSSKTLLKEEIAKLIENSSTEFIKQLDNFNITNAKILDFLLWKQPNSDD